MAMAFVIQNGSAGVLLGQKYG